MLIQDSARGRRLFFRAGFCSSGGTDSVGRINRPGAGSILDATAPLLAMALGSARPDAYPPKSKYKPVKV